MISVIIPVFNDEKTIEKALDSVRSQSWNGEFEIIIVNDGSIDNSLEVIENYRIQNSGLNISLLNQENGGVSKARNKALKIATGNYIAFLDADDEWLPTKTERQVQYLCDDKLDIDFIAARNSGKRVRYPYKTNKIGLSSITFKKLMLRNEAPTPTVIFKRKVLENTGYFDGNQRYAEDLNYWLRISLNNKMYILDEALVITGGGKRSFGVSGLSGNLSEMEKGFQKNLLEMYHDGRINWISFAGYYIFLRFKYVVRLIRDQFYKVQGK